MIQLSFIIEAQHVTHVRELARELFGVPQGVVITREEWGFGDFVEYPMAASEGGEITHYFCSDKYQEPRAAEVIGFVWRQELPYLEVIAGDPRPLLAEMGLVLQERKPEYPAQILGIDY